MGRPRHNAETEFDLTGDPGDVRTTALSTDSAAQRDAPTPRLRERPADDPQDRPTDPRSEHG